MNYYISKTSDGSRVTEIQVLNTINGLNLSSNLIWFFLHFCLTFGRPFLRLRQILTSKNRQRPNVVRKKEIFKVGLVTSKTLMKLREFGMF